MKSTYFFLAFFLVFMTFFGCRETAEEKKEKEIEMISTQTMGLAYLELFKLEEAEESFLKYITLAPDKKMGYANLGLVYLRMGKYAEAEEQLLKAMEIDAKDADINLILATVYQMSEQRDKAIAILNRSLEFDPGHEKSLYMLSELYASNEDDASQSKRKKCLVTLVQKAPNNIVPILELTAIYIRNAETDKAIEQLEIIKKQFPEFPKEAIEYYDSTLDNLRIPDTEIALTSFMIFHNYLKVTFPYQGGIKELKGSQGALVGLPLITYDLQHSSLKDEDTSILEVIIFTDATSAVGLDAVPAFPAQSNLEKQYITHVTSADYDSDGDLDIYVGSYNYEKETYEHFLFNNDLSLFWDISMDVGITHTGKESSAVFADYDNDGFLDLYIVKEGGNILYKNAGEGKFNDVTKEALLDSQRESSKALFVDLDHDGDLDIFETGPDSNYVYRNNGDGTFIEQAEKMGLAALGIKSNDAAFGDFDDDGDIDLLVTNENATNSLFSNQRQGLFKDISQDNLPHNEKGSKLVAVADWNNDGFLDLFLQGSDNRENNGLLVNQGAGRFEWAEKNQEMFKDLNNITIYDTAFFDFDNDGFLDILVVGKSKRANGRGILLYHNERDGRFTNVSQLLPEDRKAGEKIVLIDYDGDGDLDLLIAGVQGGVFLLRNDGGNLNHYVNIKLVGLRTGSAKNNYFGIGAKVEMRAGDLYQTKVVGDPNVHFGLGDRTKADIIRITWTNGVPQNILLPEGDQSLIESQSLKGSCPFLYTWNGDKFVFVKDIT
ncbi:MAG: FG-GAP-like repeat-containing protein, partial [Maribacter sp.]|uniref:FG-GAP-like repeat-containing protein n=1 Tax=Maribacter sp. TaxID=1897614 RepID=UPI003C7860CC